MSFHAVANNVLYTSTYAVNATATPVVLLILMLSSLVQFIRKDEPGPSWPKIRRLQLTLSALAVCLSAAHSFLLSRLIPFSLRADPTLVSTLFVILLWIVLTISLFENNGSARVPQYSAWGTVLIFHAVELVLTVLKRKLNRSPIVSADVVILAVRVTVVLALLLSAAVLRYGLSRGELALNADEIQPLLDPEANQSADSASKNTETTKTEEEDEDKKDDEDDPDAEERKALKQRPLKEYVASFAIFIPHMWPSSARQWFYIGIIAVCIVADRVTNLVIPLSTGALINSLQGAETIPWKQVIIYLVFYVLSSAGVVDVTQRLAKIRFESKIEVALSDYCYAHVMNLSANYHDQKASQHIRYAMDAGRTVVSLFQVVCFDLIPQLSDLVISVSVISWLFGGYICFVVTTTIVLFAYANIKFVQGKTKLRRQRMDALVEQWHHVWETLYNWATVSHFNRIRHERDVTREKTELMYKKEVLMYDYDAFAQFVRQAIVCTGYVSASLLAINQIIYGRRGVGDFVMLMTYWSRTMSPVSGLIRIINDVAGKLVDAERLMILLEKKPKIQDEPDAKDIDFQGGAVEFDNVSFSYDGERVVSQDVSFRVEAGQTVAIVGETGGGKSTLLKLLFRFYDPTKGSIKIDGQDLRTIRATSFRELIGFVPQDPAMFRRSISDNIRYSNLPATDDEVIEASKGAVLHDKILKFPKGYKQKVGERGAKLSGGEQQRLAIARTILKKPKMLLLDEATSSVDSVTETKIHEGLKALCKGRTTFIIAHRLSTILHADLILVMKNGRLVEMGKHKVLLKNEDGAYRELWDAQLKLQQEQEAEDQDDTKLDRSQAGQPTSPQEVHDEHGQTEGKDDDRDDKNDATTTRTTTATATTTSTENDGDGNSSHSTLI